MEGIEILRSCPFCQEGEFDLLGLKIHLSLGYCDVYKDLNISGHPCWDDKGIEKGDMHGGN